PQYPAERLRGMLQDSAPAAVLARGALDATLGAVAAEAGVPVVDLADSSAWADRPETNPALDGLTPDHLVYVIYTSGSTGRPKGTEVPHRAIPGFFEGVDYCRFDEQQVLLQHSSTSWDALTLELWPALLTGGACVLLPAQATEPALLGRQVREHGVTTLWLTAQYFNSIVDGTPHVLEGVRQVMIGGEAVSVPHVRRALELYPELRLVNGYGPSECTVFTTCWPVPAGSAEQPVPIGAPVGDRRVYVLDHAMNPVPVGVAGELYVGGPAVARGYLNRPALTADRFVPDPFSARAGARLYRSGDRVRWRADGLLEFVGRADAQVKIRGFRVEPGEVETVLAAYAGVREARVVVREDQPGDKRLVAYLVGDVDGESLRAHLKAALPEYMVPSALVVMERLPLTAHGKLDARALPAPELQQEEWVEPTTAVEQALAAMWAEVLRVERVGVNDDFFQLGGHSLLIMRLIARVQDAFGLELSIRTVFSAPTLGAMAGEIERKVYEDILGMSDAQAEQLAELTQNTEG
ncbi:MAG TPA: non-ribosomal peptide synthetase, partial [Longimicrobium sp.]|nr:non-ribosomal peptide synthetase [Longimicrobium sp.]